MRGRVRGEMGFLWWWTGCCLIDWLIPGSVPSPVEGFGAPSSLYQLLSGDGSLCMAFFFMLSRYSCCDTARTEAKISSSSQSVRPFTKKNKKTPPCYQKWRTVGGSKKKNQTKTQPQVDASCGFHSHPTHRPLLLLLASVSCRFLLRSRAERSRKTRSWGKICYH